ncbi:DUF397 domain-containing protein [Streptomyces griseocarneus]|uniref:DUF397 domain-containing protein n=1 Tax=Streptomyces griseocarneus TaxID=51201 RepID=UPI00167CF0C9|nr:DUF397 domain-containing protein [Streptomyces griseocarneus]MBZ6476686.1 DUF397 domain-containing protein [Streptomyces griseocarneus]GHG80333.1 hypothetical protein GCM10018779_61820 [Streptomyces griseocarneus]
MNRNEALHTADLTGAVWRKSHESNGNQACVEVTEVHNLGTLLGMAVRDSKAPHRAQLRCPTESWNAFCAFVATDKL